MHIRQFENSLFSYFPLGWEKDGGHDFSLESVQMFYMPFTPKENILSHSYVSILEIPILVGCLSTNWQYRIPSISKKPLYYLNRISFNL